MRVNRLAKGLAYSLALLCGCAAVSNAEPLRLRVGTYNIKNGEMVNLDMNVLAKDITDLKLDIVGLQEVDQMTARVKGLDTMKALSEATGMKHYRFAQALEVQGGGSGNGILSRYPIGEFEAVRLPATGSGEVRSIARAVVNVNSEKVNFFTTQLEALAAPLTWNVAVLTYLVNKCDEFIVTGDMNTADIRAFNTIKRTSFVNTNSVFKTAGKAGLDNIIHSPAWTKVDAGMFDGKHSDHALLWAELEMKK